MRGYFCRARPTPAKSIRRVAEGESEVGRARKKARRKPGKRGVRKEDGIRAGRK